MQVLWAATWRAAAQAALLGYGVLRLDADVYFHEDPYTILNGPLLRHAAMVVQQDIVGSEHPLTGPLAWTGRARCAPPAPVQAWRHGRARVPGVPLEACNQQRPPWVNNGFVYVRPASDPYKVGGAAVVLNETWSRFDAELAQPKPGRAQELLNDQRFFRMAIRGRAVGAGREKHPDAWLTIPGDAASVYDPGHCPHGDQCEEVAALRGAVPFRVQLVKNAGPGAAPRWPKPNVSTASGWEMVVAAPDWMVGRLCAVTRGAPEPTGGPQPSPQCFHRGHPGVPHPLGRALAATHMVYTKAAKRRLAFDAFGWWHQGGGGGGSEKCTPGSAGEQGVVLGHTFFGAHNTSPSALPVFCSVRRTADGCPCCWPVRGPLEQLLPTALPRLRDALTACNGWQEYFDT
eukprot:TRINITY_DN6207_c0_g1_i2.p2 TRINITY_DN6207_c0_g1~~TRINITY_DN6207_c0_g1_i2.p2  ORF type:complete len:402 (+),score=97.95 TRINITY_DN6207_c0_g1_i2:770-1975(+)